MSAMDHNPARRPASGRQQIGVRALLGAGGHEPRIALLIPGVPTQVRLSASDAEQLAAAIVQTLQTARERLAPPPCVQAGGDEAMRRREDEEGPR